jgi:hypothetical protein
MSTARKKTKPKKKPAKKKTAPRRRYSTAKIESVVITWCSRKDHKRRRVHVDLKKVDGFIWRVKPRKPITAVGARPSVRTIPHTKIEIVGLCSPIHPDGFPDDDPDSGCCWWDPQSSSWVCPDEPTA